MNRTPLAWLNLTHDPRRLALAVAGIGFAVLLMCMELSIRKALVDNSIAVIEHMNGQLFIVSKAEYTIAVREGFSHQRLAQARGCPAVRGAYPLYIETHRSSFKNLDLNGEAPPIRVLAFKPDDPVFDFPQVESHRRELRLPNRALYDNKSKDEYGAVTVGQRVELAEHALQIVGLFSLGTDFANDGNLITSDLTYRDMFPTGPGRDPLTTVDVGIIRLNVNKKRDVLEACRDLRQRLPPDVDVLTKDEFVARERLFWNESTPIGFIFWLGTWMGFIVGSVICYQILSTDVTEHLPQFATLKAMGYANRYFVWVILQEAVFLSLMGFVPGVLLSMLFCWAASHLTHLTVDVPLLTAIQVLLISMAMCAVSARLAVQRVMRVDPAELFA
jgi:putative ABC transport system permease protein